MLRTQTHGNYQRESLPRAAAREREILSQMRDRMLEIRPEAAEHSERLARYVGRAMAQIDGGLAEMDNPNLPDYTAAGYSGAYGEALAAFNTRDL